MGIECGIGVGTKSLAEWEKRKGAFWNELDFVAADVAMAIIADFCLVWLPAPTLRLGDAKSAGKFLNSRRVAAFNTFLSTCPDNAFQVATLGQRWTMVQRGTAVVKNGSKLFLVWDPRAQPNKVLPLIMTQLVKHGPPYNNFFLSGDHDLVD
jgi:hypothetical protein